MDIVQCRQVNSLQRVIDSVSLTQTASVCFILTMAMVLHDSYNGYRYRNSCVYGRGSWNLWFTGKKYSNQKCFAQILFAKAQKNCVRTVTEKLLSWFSVTPSQEWSDLPAHYGVRPSKMCFRTFWTALAWHKFAPPPTPPPPPPRLAFLQIWLDIIDTYCLISLPLFNSYILVNFSLHLPT